MNYGVRTSGDKVLGIIATSAALPQGYVSLTKYEYDQGQSESNKHEALLFDFDQRLFIPDNAVSTLITSHREKEEQRAQLRSLSIELDLMARLGEDTTALQQEFNTLMAAYQG